MKIQVSRLIPKYITEEKEYYKNFFGKQFDSSECDMSYYDTEDVVGLPIPSYCGNSQMTWWHDSEIDILD